jgi:FAD:protein FMN transferase
VAFRRPGVLIDLGAIGKGFAMDEAVQILRELGVDRAFLHGGTSTIYGLGRPLDADAWKVAVPPPGGLAEGGEAIAVVSLEDEALSVSAVWGKAFVADGQTFGHVLDPRSGRPVEGAVLTAVVLPSATESDALSTAFLVLGREATSLAHSERPDMRALVVCPVSGTDPPRFDVIRHGLAQV